MIHSLPATVAWDNGRVVLIDQKRLPAELRLVKLKTVNDVVNAIKDMTVRGAPAIGVTAAMGLALTACQSRSKNRDELLNELHSAKQLIQQTRPTAVNLFWALERVMKRATSITEGVEAIRGAVITEARRIAEEDVQINHQLGAHGAKLLIDGDKVLTHCK